MTYLLDTCIISKLRKLRLNPNPELEKWFTQHSETSYYLSVITLGEIQGGIAKFSQERPEENKQRMLLEDWLFGELVPRFNDRILPIDSHVAFTWGCLNGKSQQNGKKIPIADGLIAATAIHYGLIVVTENLRDFKESQVEVINPSRSEPG